MEEEFYSSYKRKLDNLSGVPDDDVWKNISEAISERRALPERKRRGIGFVLVFFLTLFSLITYLFNAGDISNRQLTSSGYGSNYKILERVSNPACYQTKFALKNNSTLLKNSKSPHNGNIIQSVSQVSQRHSIVRQGQSFQKYTVKTSFVPNVQTLDLLAKAGKMNPFFISPKSVTLIATPLLVPQINYTPGSIYPQDTCTRDTTLAHFTLKKTISVGISFVGHNPWLLNYVTRNAFDQNKPEILNFSVNYSLSAFCSYSVKKSTLQAEFILNQKAEQSYQTYAEGHSYKKDLLLKYTQCNLIDKIALLKRNRKGILSQQISFLCGLSHGYLNAASKKTNGSIENVMHDYHRHSFGLITGAEYQIGVRRFFMAASLRANMGINNIYAGSPSVPKELNQTYNSGFSIVGSLGYHL